MALTRFRLCEQDRAQFGGPEWVTFDLGRLVKARAKELELIEEETGHPIARLMRAVAGDHSILGLRMVVWVARYQSDIRTPFDEFDIHAMQMDSELVEDQAEPDVLPLSGSSSPSEAPA